MRLIKLALISFLVFFGIITAMSLLVPSHIRISKAINIANAPDTVFSLINSRSAWPRWHPAFTASNGDSILSANGIVITPLAHNDSLAQWQWQQQGRNPVVNSWQLHRFAASDSLTLQWYMDFKLRWYPWEKFSSLFFEKTYGLMMEKGLQNIKKEIQTKE